MPTYLFNFCLSTSRCISVYHISHRVAMSACLPACRRAWLSVCLSVFSVRLCEFPGKCSFNVGPCTVCLSMFLVTCCSIHPFVCLSVHIHVHVNIHAYIHKGIHVSIRVSVSVWLGVLPRESRHLASSSELRNTPSPPSLPLMLSVCPSLSLSEA